MLFVSWYKSASCFILISLAWNRFIRFRVIFLLEAFIFPPSNLRSGCVFHTSTQIILGLIVVSELDWRKRGQPSSTLLSRGWGEGKAAPYPSRPQRARSVICILHPLPVHLGHFRTFALFLHLLPHAFQRVHRLRASQKGCRSAVLITRSLVTFAAGVCSRYPYLPSQLHWQHTQSILGALLNSQTKWISFYCGNSLPSFILSKRSLSFSLDDLLNAAVQLPLQCAQLFPGISLCALSLQSALNGGTTLL